jgi:leader peptidase (prepilin peptidase)/N-methyltransferase
VNATDFDEPIAIAITAPGAAALGVAAGVVLVQHGLARLDVDKPARAARLGAATGLLGGLGGAAGAVQADSLWLLPALLVWACALTAAAACDALTQRVPTSLVRQAAVITLVLVVAASAVTAHWDWTWSAVAVSLASGFIFAIFWRFFGAGFGDVRLAVLGGLGVAHPTRVVFLVGFGAFVLITLSQAAVTLARGGTRHSLFPYGPAIAAAFLIAGGSAIA